VLFVRRPEEVDEAEEQDIAHMVSASAEIAATYELAQRFAQMVRQRLPETLSPWLEAAHSTIVTEFRQFGASLAQDKAAVAAALQYPWSNGQAEGQINRLKLIKRKMYGRANFDLLRQRVLAA
jgi:transposase